jgi:hypothetical protein
VHSAVVSPHNNEPRPQGTLCGAGTSHRCVSLSSIGTQRSTHPMTRTMILARLAAVRAVKQGLHAQGLRPDHVEHQTIIAAAQNFLRIHPELFEQAERTAAVSPGRGSLTVNHSRPANSLRNRSRTIADCSGTRMTGRYSKARKSTKPRHQRWPQSSTIVELPFLDRG